MRFTTIVTISLLLLSVTACRGPRLVSTEIKGTTANARLGAVVISDTDSIPYYVDRLPSWPNDQLGKTVSLRGQLEVKDFKPVIMDTVPQRTTIDLMHIVRKPRWEFVP